MGTSASIGIPFQIGKNHQGMNYGELSPHKLACLGEPANVKTKPGISWHTVASTRSLHPPLALGQRPRQTWAETQHVQKLEASKRLALGKKNLACRCLTDLGDFHVSEICRLKLHHFSQKNWPTRSRRPHPRKARHWRPFDWTSPVGVSWRSHLGGDQARPGNVAKLWVICGLQMRLSNGYMMLHEFPWRAWVPKEQKETPPSIARVWIRKFHKVPVISPPSRWLDGKRSYFRGRWCNESGRHFRGSLAMHMFDGPLRIDILLGTEHLDEATGFLQSTCLSHIGSQRNRSIQQVGICWCSNIQYLSWVRGDYLHCVRRTSSQLSWLGPQVTPSDSAARHFPSRILFQSCLPWSVAPHPWCNRKLSDIWNKYHPRKMKKTQQNVCWPSFIFETYSNSLT